MHVSQTGVFETTVAAAAILTIREENTYTRVLSFRNISGNTLAIEIKQSPTGAVGTWVTDTTSFNLVDGAVAAVVPVSSNQLQITVSNVAADPGIEINYSRIEADSAAGIWSSPQV